MGEDVVLELLVAVAVDVEVERTQCQLRGSSGSISVVGEQPCSSMKTRVRTFMASWKMGGLVLGSWGRERVPGGGWMAVVMGGLDAMVLN